MKSVERRYCIAFRIGDRGSTEGRSLAPVSWVSSLHAFFLKGFQRKEREECEGARREGSGA
jgi:hypothetical protein